MVIGERRRSGGFDERSNRIENMETDVADQHDNAPDIDEQAAQADAGEVAGDVESGTGTELEALQAELVQAREELTDAREQALRVAAEAQNVRRRADKDVENARKFALERFAGDLLPVIDNLERALDAADRNVAGIKPLLEGVELTHKSFLDVMKKFQVEQIDPVGEPFDPQLHEAMSMVENPEVEPNTVLHVMQRGYTLAGRLLRAAMVMVSKGGAPGKKVDETA